MHKKNQFCTPILLTRCRYPKRFFKDFPILHTHPVLDFWPIDILKLLLHIHWKANDKKQKLVFKKTHESWLWTMNSARKPV